MKKLVLVSSLSVLVATFAYAYNITHPDLKQAFASAEQAIKQVEQAQQQEAKGVNFGGHANKAISLLQQAQKELNEADQYNDSHQKKPK
jgi:hypothetical protein